MTVLTGCSYPGTRIICFSSLHNEPFSKFSDISLKLYVVVVYVLLEGSIDLVVDLVVCFLSKSVD